MGFDEKSKYEFWAKISNINHKLDRLWWKIEKTEELDNEVLELYDKNISDCIRELQYISTSLHHKYNEIKDDKK